MTRLTALLNRHVVPALTALSGNTYMSAIRAGMVSVQVPQEIFRAGMDFSFPLESCWRSAATCALST